jgi:hypothetical protein
MTGLDTACIGKKADPRAQIRSLTALSATARSARLQSHAAWEIQQLPCHANGNHGRVVDAQAKAMTAVNDAGRAKLRTTAHPARTAA